MKTQIEKGVLRSSILTKPEPEGNTLSDSGQYVNENDSHYTDTYKHSNLIYNDKFQTDSIKQLSLKVGAVESISANQLIDGRFIPSALLQALVKKHGKKVILLRAGLGTGKSWALSELMQSHKKGRGVAASHRVGLVEQLSKQFSADNYQAVKDAGGEYSDRLGTTIHSLPRMLATDRTSKAFDGGVFVLDESNSCAAEITNSTIKNEGACIRSIGDAYKKSDLTVCADAHLDLATVELLEAAGVPAENMLLILVKYPELAGYRINIWQDEKDNAGKPATKAAFMNQILADVQGGLKVIVTSLSAAFLEELDREAGKRGILDGYGGKRLVTSKTAKADREALTADSYQHDRLTMLSPAMSTGISFNRTIISENGNVTNCPDYKHADRCYVVLSNGMDTGGYQDGLQAMMRERAVKDKTINCYYAESPVPLPSASRIALVAMNDTKALWEVIAHLAKYAPPGINPVDIWNSVRPSQNEADRFLLSQALRTGDQKRDFLRLFVEECQLKGASINYSDLAELANGGITFQSLQAEKLREREEWVQARSDAIKLDTDDASGLDDDLAIPALDRRYIEEQAVIDFDQLEPLERKEWIERIYPESGKRGIQHIAREIERSQTDPKILAEIVSAGLLGVSGGDGDQVRFLEKSSTDKKHWFHRAKYTSALLKACGVELIDGDLVAKGDVTLSASEIRKMKHQCYGLYTSLKQNPADAIQCRYLNIETKPEAVKADPLPFIVEMMGQLGIKTRKTRNKEEWTVKADSLHVVLEMVNRRKSAGVNELKNWLDVIAEYINSYHSRMATKADRDMSNRESAPDNVLDAVTVALEKESAIEMLDAAISYFEPFHDRIKTGKLSAVAIQLMVKRWLETDRV